MARHSSYFLVRELSRNHSGNALKSLQLTLPFMVFRIHYTANAMQSCGSLRKRTLRPPILYFAARELINGRIGTYEEQRSFQVSPRVKQYQTKSSARSAIYPAQQSPSKTRRSPKGGGAATNGRHRRHLADAGHGHAVVDF